MTFGPKFAFLLLRLFLGGMLAYGGWSKLQMENWPGIMRTEIESWDAQAQAPDPKIATAQRIYQQPDARAAVHDFAMQNAGTLAQAVLWGELVGGVFIVLGFLTSFALLGQIVLNASILLLGGHMRGMEPVNLAFVAIGLALLFARGGRAFGVDGKLHERFEESFLGRLVF